MAKQSFRVIIRVDTDVEITGKPYLTEARVKKQIEKFLKGRRMTEGLPCHGESEIRVVDVIEDNPKS